MSDKHLREHRSYSVPHQLLLLREELEHRLLMYEYVLGSQSLEHAALGERHLQI